MQKVILFTHLAFNVAYLLHRREGFIEQGRPG